MTTAAPGFTLHASLTGPGRLRLERRQGGRVTQSWEAWLGMVGKTRVWVIDQGKTTLAAVCLAIWPGERPDPQWLQEQLDQALALRAPKGRSK